MKKMTFASLAFLLICGLLIALPAFADPILGRMTSYTVACSGTARTLANSAQTLNRNIVSFRFFVPSGTAVFIGDSNVNTTVGSGGTGMPYCSSAGNCVADTDTIDGNPANLYCRTAGSTIQVVVLAGVK
jgi:hypothetical protein